MPYQHLLRDPVIIILMAASLVSWIIIADRLLTIRRSAKADDAFLKGEPALSAPLAVVRQELKRYSESDKERLLVRADTVITLERHRLERALPLLGVIGSTAPYMGLLGTVIGIIQAFQAIQAENTMSPSVVAGGIATALVATAAGLAVAIPAVAAHHLLAAAVGRRVACWESAVSEWLQGKGIEA